MIAQGPDHRRCTVQEDLNHAVAAFGQIDHARHAHQPGHAVDLRRARAAFARLAVPAHGQVRGLLGLDVVHRVEHDHAGADLGLYSVTFTNNAERDHKTLRIFRDFRLHAEKKKFRYFLEVFNPNVDARIPPEEVGSFINDHIARTLAGVPSAGRPIFLKIPYNGARALEELVMYDPQLVVGILGGSSGTTHDAFKLIADARKYGARVALFLCLLG